MKILIAEDDLVSRRALESFLKKWGHTVVTATDGDEAWAALNADDAPPLAILDWMMPGMDGIELCRALRNRGYDPYTYILLLTAKGQKQDIVEGIEAGADDYLTKPFDPQELRVRIRAGIRLLELQQALRVQATHDALTGVWNRRGIVDLLQRELSRSVRRNTPVGLVMVDIDHFKGINDRFGHDAGDVVLRAVAERMETAIRSYDFLGRYGGEEFLIFAPDCDPRTTLALAERVRLSVAREPIAIPGSKLFVTASFGVSGFDGTAGAGLDTVLRTADDALYLAKQRGRNRVETTDRISLLCTDPLPALV